MRKFLLMLLAALMLTGCNSRDKKETVTKPSEKFTPLVAVVPTEQQQAAAERRRQAEETARKLREELGDEIPCEVNTAGNPGSNRVFNPTFRNVKTFINRRNGVLSIYFDYDPTRSPEHNHMRNFNLLVRMFDNNGQYLTHFSTKQDYMSSPDDPTAESIYVCSESSGCLGESHEAIARQSFPTLKRKGNFLQFEINLRDAGYIMQTEFGAQAL